MSTAAIWEQLSSRVQAVTGRPLPPPDAAGGPEFEALMAEIKAKDPALFREILDAASGGAELPAEKEAAREQARRRLVDIITSPLRRPDGLRTGRKRLNTTAMIFLAAAVLVAVALLTQSGSPPAGNRAQRSREPAAAQASPPPSPAPSPETHGPAAEQPPAAPSRQRAGEVQPPAVPADGAAAEQAGPFGAPPPAPPLPAPPAAPVQTAAPQPQPAQEPPAVLFRSPTARAQEGGAGAVLYRTRGDSPQAAAPAPHLAFKASQPEGQAQDQQRPAVLYRAGQGERAGQPEGQQLPPAAPQEGQPAPPAPSLHPGQVFQAKLALPVSVSPAWGPVPALAEVTDGPLAGSLLWGQARMAGDGSVEISFNQVIREGGRSAAFNGVAYDPVAGRPSLTGQVRTVMPNAAQTILSSSLQAASDYFKARVQSQSVTITNGFVTIQQSEPSFWDVYSQSLAQAMTPKTPQGSGPVVVAHIPKGTVISVIAMSEFSAGKP